MKSLTWTSVMTEPPRDFRRLHFLSGVTQVWRTLPSYEWSTPGFC